MTRTLQGHASVDLLGLGTAWSAHSKVLARQRREKLMSDD